MLWYREKSFIPSGNRTLTVQSVAIPTELFWLRDRLYSLHCINEEILCLGCNDVAYISEEFCNSLDGLIKICIHPSLFGNDDNRSKPDSGGN
jgi:hypothetical protein